MNDIGDRMKSNYEDRARHYLTRRTPVIIRVDGRAFHTFTRGFDAFDPRIFNPMCKAAQALCEDAQGAKMAYIQSDEISVLLTDWDRIETGAWFDYNKSKVESISASIVTAEFNHLMLGGLKRAHFDARAFNLPESEIANYFLWRAKDWYRNSITTFARQFFSHRELENKSCGDTHEMLHKIGENWTTLSSIKRNGIFIERVSGYQGMKPVTTWRTHSDILPKYESVSELVGRVMP